MAQQPPNVLAPEATLTRFQAQRKLGLFAPMDYTIFALTDGQVAFKTGAKGRVFVSVVPTPEAPEAKAN